MEDLINVAADLYKKGNYQEAIQRINEARKAGAQSGRQTVQLHELTGKCLAAIGRQDEALAAFAAGAKKAREMFSAGECTAGDVIVTLQNQAHACVCANRQDEAESYAGEALQIALSSCGSHSPQYAAALFHAASPAYRRKDFQTAASRLHEAIEVWKAQNTQPEQLGTCLNNLGRVYEEMGDTTRAIHYHHEAVEYRRKLPNKEDLAFSLGNYGIALATAGQLDEACRALRESLETYARLNQSEGMVAQSFRVNLENLEKWNAGT